MKRIRVFLGVAVVMSVLAGFFPIYGATLCDCDLNSDGRCNMSDWLLFGQRWGATNCNTVPCACDLNDDGRCNMSDWLLFGKNWGRTDCSVTTTIDYPGASYTCATDIYGNTVVGYYSLSEDPVAYHSFLYDLTTKTYSTFNVSGAYLTQVFSIVGNTLVGMYDDANRVAHGFIYENGTTTTLNYPGSDYTCATGIYGNTVVGYYSLSEDPVAYHSFLYDLTTKTYSTFDVSGAYLTQVFSIVGNTLVGMYDDANRVAHGFIANI